jgi:tRNA A58 N-methylase Trm61
VPWFGPIAQGLVQELVVRPGERVVGAGYGCGAALVPLAHATGPTGPALGLDLTPRMVERTAQDLRWCSANGRHPEGAGRSGDR